MMRRLFVVVLLGLARGYEWSEEWYGGLPVDHFSYGDNRTFDLRFLLNKRHWNAGGPIFFYTGGEGDIAWFANNTGFMWDLAPEFGAMVVFAEHRYYGRSLPFGEASFESAANLGKLSTQQALADYAVLVEWLKRTTAGARRSPVVAFGGSYAGMLAAWWRIKYPHVVVEALASSAPILEHEAMTPCNSYPSIVTRTFRNSGPNCAETIRSSWAAFRRVAATPEGRRWLNEAFHICPTGLIEKESHVQALIQYLAGSYGDLAMIDYPYPSNFLSPVPAWPVRVACRFLTDPHAADRDLLRGIYAALAVYTNSSGQADCVKIRDGDKHLAARTTPYLDAHGLWGFQACSDFYDPICRTGVDDMFFDEPWDFDSYSDSCAEQWWGVRPRRRWGRTFYGGDHLQDASNIIFSNGDLDPWSGGGVTQPVVGGDGSIHVIVIHQGAHHLDLRPENAADTEYVRRARAIERRVLSDWIRHANRLSSASAASAPSPSRGPRSGASPIRVLRAVAASQRSAAAVSGRVWLNKAFNLCSSSLLKRSADVDYLIDWLVDVWGNLAMVNYPYETNFLAPVPGWPVKAACTHMTTPNASDKALVVSIFNGVSVFLNYTGQTDCFNVKQDASPKLGENGWDYQSCTEMVMPMCSNGSGMFEEQKWSLAEYERGCRARYFNTAPRPAWAMTNYGGARLQAASNIVFR